MTGMTKIKMRMVMILMMGVMIMMTTVIILPVKNRIHTTSSGDYRIGNR